MQRIIARWLLVSGFAFAAAPWVCAEGLPAIPGVTSVPGAAESAAAASAPVTAGLDEAAIRSRLEEARQALNNQSAADGNGTGAPPGTPKAERFARSFMLQTLVSAYQLQLDSLQRLAIARNAKARGESPLLPDERLPEPPPYPVPVVDELRQRVQTVSQQLDVMDLEQQLADRNMESARKHHVRAEQNLRESAEALERNRDPAATARLKWLYDKAALELKAGGAMAQAREFERQLLVVERARVNARIRALQDLLARAEGNIRFEKQDLDTLIARGEARARDMQAELRAARAEAQSRTERVAALEATVEQQHAALKQASDALEAALAVSEALTDKHAAERASAREKRKLALESAVEAARQRLDESLAELDLERFRAETALLRTESLTRLESSLHLQRTFWELRFAAGQPGAQDDSTRRLHEGVTTLLKQIEEPERVASAALRLSLEQAAEIQSRLFSLSDARASAERAYLASNRERIDSHLRTIAEIAQLKQLVGRWAEEFDRTLADRSAKAKWNDFTDSALEQADAFWSYELVTVDDSMLVDGQTVAIKRGVTIGKVVIAVLTLIVGFWLARRIAALMIVHANRRFGTPIPTLKTASNWLLSLVFVVLVLISLAMVRIPLTVFAFLGGAIAIGLGFGMQTLLKNLMSGLMLLAERPFKLGDFVEVGGMRGTVTDIGVRASTIRNADGIETLVPNASFVEQNVVNWTYSSSKVRFSVKVGVAYGSPIRAVADRLAEVVSRHGQILKDPAPEVLFEDFAADALNFGVYFWLDLESGATGRAVCSDVRFMIDKSFAEAGIVIAFPQRDVHLDSAKPLEVRLIGATPESPA